MPTALQPFGGLESKLAQRLKARSGHRRDRDSLRRRVGSDIVAVVVRERKTRPSRS